MGEQAREPPDRTPSAEIAQVGEALELPSEVLAFAEQIYRQSRKDPNADFWNHERTALAACYLASKVNGEPVDPAEFTSSGDVSIDRKFMLRRATDIKNHLSLDVEPFYDCSSYIESYCEELGVGEELEQRALEIVEISSEADIAGGKSPRGWAASAIYLAAVERGRDVTQADVAEVANVTDVTIRLRYQEHRDAVFEHELAQADAHEVIEWYDDRLDLDGRLISRARESLSFGEDAGYPVDESPEWPAAALRLAAETFDEAISWRALRIPIDVQAGELTSRMTKLRDVLQDHS